MPSSTGPQSAPIHQLPSRHIVSGTSVPGFTKQHVHVRSPQPPSARLGSNKDAATRSSLAHTHASSSSNAAYACRNCHQSHTRFYCKPCLTSRIQAHRNEIQRLSHARDSAKASVNQLLFGQTASASESPPTSSVRRPSSAAVNESTLPHPFDPNAPESSSSSSDPAHHHPLLHPLLQARARSADVLSRVQTIHRSISESQQSHLQSQEILKDKIAHINLRKQNLAKAWSRIEGSSASSSPSASQRSRLAAKSRWLAHPAADHIDVPLGYTDVYNTHYERHIQDSDQARAPASAPDDQQLGASLTRARLQLASLQSQATSVSAELAATRALLARKAFQLFCVAPPDNAPTKLPSNPSRQRQVDLSASSSVAQRISRLSERYIPGAFGLGYPQSPPWSSQSRRADGASRQSSTATRLSSSPSSSNWSIANLPLPLPSEAQRYPRETINGSVTYTANLLQLLAGYLGISLPFSIEQHRGRLAIRPDPLWDGGGGSSAKSLYLSSSAYSHLTASHSAAARASKLNNLAESTIGLGASTLSTIESYIHLPSGAGLSWGLTSHVASSVKPGASATRADPGAEHQRTSSDESRTNTSSTIGATTSSKSKPDLAARSFVSALVMLSYDVAYLAAKQGIAVDLVAAAANPLSVLTKIINQSELGCVAHSNHIRSSTIQDLSLPSVRYEQLAQILEPMNAAADGHKRGASRPARPESTSTAITRSPGSDESPEKQKDLEQSYVDVQEAAASVLDIKDPSLMLHRTSQQPHTTRSSVQTASKDAMTASSRPSPRQLDGLNNLQKQRGGADRRNGASAQPAPSLEFLRQRGRDASEVKNTQHSTKALSAAAKARTLFKNDDQEAEAKVRPGAVIFNGLEVGIGTTLNTTEANTSRRNSQKLRKQSTEAGWDLV